ncbi:unnamed protein product, partial [Polarella glacialis]
VSIVSPKPQTTRQRILGLALLSPRPNSPPTTQAVFVDTAGIMQLTTSSEFGGSFRHKQKKLFRHSKLHKAMVKTAWKSVRDVDATFWVLDASKCSAYGGFLPESPELDGISVGPTMRDAWWTHPELEEELCFLRELKKRKKQVSVVFNKTDVLQEMGVDIEGFCLEMRERLERDLGRDEQGEALLINLWPTSVLKEPESLLSLQRWLCENLPEQSPIYPVENISDVPARVAASEITREKLMCVLRDEVPYQLTVVNVIWRENPDGRLQLGQKVVVMTQGQCNIVRGKLREITEDA